MPDNCSHKMSISEQTNKYDSGLKNNQESSQSQTEKPQEFCMTITMATGPLFAPRCFDRDVQYVKNFVISYSIYTSYNNNMRRFDLNQALTILYCKCLMKTNQG